MDGSDGDFEGADVVGGGFGDGDAEVVIGCVGVASDRDGDVLVEGDAFDQDALEERGRCASAEV